VITFAIFKHLKIIKWKLDSPSLGCLGKVGIGEQQIVCQGKKANGLFFFVISSLVPNFRFPNTIAIVWTWQYWVWQKRTFRKITSTAWHVLQESPGTLLQNSGMFKKAFRQKESAVWMNLGRICLPDTSAWASDCHHRKQRKTTTHFWLTTFPEEAGYDGRISWEDVAKVGPPQLIETDPWWWVIECSSYLRWWIPFLSSRVNCSFLTISTPDHLDSSTDLKSKTYFVISESSTFKNTWQSNNLFIVKVLMIPILSRYCHKIND